MNNSTGRAWTARDSLFCLAVTFCAVPVACSSPSGPPSGSGGASTTGGAPTSGGASSGGSTVSSGGALQTGGTSSSSGGATSGGVSSSGGASGGSVSSGGSLTASGGSTIGGASGAGGSTASGGSSGGGGASGAAGSVGAMGGGGGSDSGGACPANATFCSDFEMQGLPMGAVYAVNAAPGDWGRDFGIDTTQHHGGNSSLLVKNQSASGSSGSAYRMLAVPTPTGAFWVRFWIRSDMPIGNTDHNAFAGASIGSMPNDAMIEIAEDVGLAFNTADSVQWPMGYGRTQSGGTKPYTLPAMTWECIEASFDGNGREQQLFVNNVQLIDAKNYPGATQAIKFFKFGFNAYHGPARQVWFDDVAVAPARIGGCPTVQNSNM